VPGDEDQQRRGNELRQADHAEQKRAVGQFIKLPGDNDADHLRREGRESAAAEIKLERTIAYQGSGQRCGHRSISVMGLGDGRQPG
jgi:hypothetical protein